MTEEQNKYKVNVKKTAGKKVDPSQYKDFGKVYNKYSHWVYRNPWNRFQFHKSKNRKVTLFIFLLVLVATLVVLEYLEEVQ